MFLVHHADHLLPRYLERCTKDDGRGSGQVQPIHARERLVSNEVTGGEQSDRGFLAVRRNDCEFCAARPKIEDGVSRASLRKEDLLWLQVDDFSSHSCFFQKGGEVKGHASHPRHLNGPSRMRSSREQFGRELDRFRLEEARIAILASRMHTTLLSSEIVGAILCLRGVPKSVRRRLNAVLGL